MQKSDLIKPESYKRSTIIYSRLEPSFDSIPKNVMHSLENYVLYGYMPGHFLTAILSNNLHEAVSRADAQSAEALYAIARFVYMKLPAGCWGNMDKVNAWRPDIDRATELWGSLFYET